ncbi:MAG TPA: serine/threonine-protein kinase, partial [Polyangiaceae bacterium]|nr:serine/threonine-protein kinase [Polyangiaceae bacterium]
MHITAGDVLASRYRADALLGRGGMGEVWRAFDLEEKRDVAVKTVLAEHLTNPDVRRLFQAEVIAVARLSHPGIVEVYDLLHTGDGGSLLVMEYRAGQALDQALLSKPSWSLVRAILVQLLEALAHAHARSVLHLDLKPANVLVEKQGEGVRATLVDFGIARVKRPGRGAEKWFESGVLVGTLEYMAPEQCRGQLERFGPWTDLYALGMMAYELCTGELPFPVYDPQKSMRQRLSEPAPLLLPQLNSVPPEFPELCARLLAIEPRDRFACAADVLAELERIDPHDAQRSDLRGLASDPPADSQRLGAATAPTLAARETDAPTLLAHRRVDAIMAELDREQQALDAVPSTLSMPPSSSHRSGAEEAFNAEAAAPTPGAYGLFGLRELPVLGRVHERRAVWSAVGAAALERRPGAVMLIGPAGTGKSRLARDAVERALELGLCNVLHTHWSAGGSADEGLRGMIENALESRGYRGTEFDDRLSFWLERLPGEHAFGREVRVLLRPEQDAAPDAALPIRVAVEAATRFAMVRPVLLWLDDVQWSRGEAAALVRALAERKPLPPICIVVTVREEEAIDSELDALVDALEAWCTAGAEEDHTDLVRLPMRPLGQSAARVLIRGLLYLDRDLTDVI